MKYSELVDSGSSAAKQHDYLEQGRRTSITLCVSHNPKAPTTKAHHQHVYCFFTPIHVCIIDELTSR